MKTENDDVPLLTHHAESDSSCCRFFKKFKQNVLPTKFDVYHLFITAVSLMGACAALSAMVAEAAQEAICDTRSNNTCDYFFPNATTDQLHDLSDMSHDVFNSIISSGTLLGAVASVIIPIATLSLAVCIKQRMSTNEQRSIDEHSVNFK